MKWRRVCIIGVGLLGGSIGMRLRRDHLANEVVGLGRDPKKLELARSLGAIDRGAADSSNAARDADLIIACTPVQHIADSIFEASSHAVSDACFTDVGSTKSSIVASLDDSPLGTRFIGSHPIAGSDKSGVEYSMPTLFDGKRVILTPGRATHRDTQRLITEFWQSIGAETRIMSAEAHDEAIALTSHLPHLIASMLAAATPQHLLEMTGTGWSDTTRVAGGSPVLWRQILEENQGPVLRALKNFATISAEWSAALEANDFERVEQLLIAGKEIRDIVGNRYSSG